MEAGSDAVDAAAALGGRAHRRGASPWTVAADILLTALAVLAVAAAAFMELLLDYPLPRWFYTVAVPLLVAGACAAFAASRRAGTRSALRIPAATWFAAALVLVVLHAVPWSTRKPFLERLWSIEVGMDVDQVYAIMDGYIEGTGWRLPRSPEVTIADSLVFRHSTEPSFDSDWGVVRFEGDRVAEVEFLPD